VGDLCQSPVKCNVMVAYFFLTFLFFLKLDTDRDDADVSEWWCQWMIVICCELIDWLMAVCQEQCIDARDWQTKAAVVWTWKIIDLSPALNVTAAT